MNILNILVIMINYYKITLRITSIITGNSNGDGSSSGGPDDGEHSDSSDAESTMNTDHSSDIEKLCYIIRKIFT